MESTTDLGTSASSRWLVTTEEAFVPTDNGGRLETLHFLQAAVASGVRLSVVVTGPGDRSAHASALPDAAFHWIERRTGVLSHLSSRPYMFVSRPEPAGFVAAFLEQHGDDPFTLVVAQSFRTSHLAIALARALQLPLVVRPHNVESQYYRALGRGLSLRSIAFQAEALKLRRAEAQVHADAAVTLFADISLQDARTRATRTRRPVVHLPPVLPPSTAEVDAADPSREPDTVVFVGSLDNGNNISAIGWFVSDVWPRVIASRPQSRFHVVGRRAPRSLERLLTGAGVELTKDAPSTAPHLARASVFVNPMLAGSGVNMKVVEAMAAGVPVVTTRAGSRGLAWEDGRDLLVADTAEEFARAVVSLLDDPDARRHLAARGRAFVREHLDGGRAMARLRAVSAPPAPADRTAE